MQFIVVVSTVACTPYFIPAEAAAAAHGSQPRPVGSNCVMSRLVGLGPAPRVRDDSEVDEHAEAEIDEVALELLQRGHASRVAKRRVLCARLGADPEDDMAST